MLKKFLANTRKPGKTLSGKVCVNMMNKGHARIHRWGLSHIDKQDVNEFLDIGCGGGIIVDRLLKIYENRTDIAILVSKYYAVNHHKDDIALKIELEKRGYKAQIVAWDDDCFDFEKTKAAVIRSCWDYDQRVDEFHEKMRDISKKTQLVNNINMILHNSSKFYLKELKEKGIKIIPTDFIRSEKEIDAVIDRFDADEIVIKPVISASGRDTFKGLKQDREKYRDKILSILKKKSVMIQKYISTVETLGEKSVVVINGEITYVMLKKPEKDNFLVHIHHGGTYTPVKAEEDEKEFCRQILNTFEKKTSYMRVDLLRDEETNELMLLEMELIEPNLYLAENKRGLNLLCDSLIGIMSRLLATTK